MLHRFYLVCVLLLLLLIIIIIILAGSNSVNVFLGLGLPWVVCSMYYLYQGVPYYVAGHSLASSVTLFTICGLTCIFLLIFRRIVSIIIISMFICIHRIITLVITLATFTGNCPFLTYCPLTSSLGCRAIRIIIILFCGSNL